MPINDQLDALSAAGSNAAEESAYEARCAAIADYYPAEEGYCANCLKIEPSEPPNKVAAGYKLCPDCDQSLWDELRDQGDLPRFHLTPADPVTRSIVVGFTASGSIRLSTPPNLMWDEVYQASKLIQALYNGAKR